MFFGEKEKQGTKLSPLKKNCLCLWPDFSLGNLRGTETKKAPPAIVNQDVHNEFYVGPGMQCMSGMVTTDTVRHGFARTKDRGRLDGADLR